MPSSSQPSRWTHVLLFAAGMTGCSQAGPTGASNVAGSGSATSELHFALTDAPGPFDQILVHVTAIDVHQAVVGAQQPAVDQAGSWTNIGTLDQTIDLLTLQNGVTLDAGGATLPAGAYDMVRLLVSSGDVVVGGQTFPLTIPSGMQSGVKLRYDLNLDADVSTTITLDFDGAASVVQTGQGAYLLQPVLSVKSRDDHSRVSGDGAASDPSTDGAPRSTGSGGRGGAGGGGGAGGSGGAGPGGSSSSSHH